MDSIRVASTFRPDSTVQKRAGGRLNDRAAKRRSPRACLSCRARKVRCDVLNSDVPCTNCRLDDVNCVVKESSRGRKRNGRNPNDSRDSRNFRENREFRDSSQPVISAASPHSVGPAQQQVTPPHTDLVSLTFEDQNSRAQSGEPGNDSQNGIDDEHDPPQHPQQILDHPVQHLDTADQPRTSPILPQRSLQHNNHNPTPSNHGGREQAAANVSAPLPPYIRHLPSRISQRDIEYLTEKDAFTIPDDEFRDELLRTYVRIIHCFMPAIDLDELLVPIIRANGYKPISLLLFQAVMFASVIFVDSDFLRSRGYSSRKAARKVFFNRVRLLYGLDCEPDRLALVQALLLMTYWYDSPDDEKDTWYWMGITLSLTQVLGLHRDPETLNISLREKRLRRRIWWSCYIRDRLLALGIRRPARIRQEDFHVSMLELDDFDLERPTPEHIAFVGACGYTTPEADRRRAMCQICIELARLCVCIGEILYSQYSVVGNQSFNYEPYKNLAVLPKDVDQQMSELVRCDTMLEDWHRNQKATCWYSPPSPGAVSGFGDNNGDDWAEKTTWLHQALLRMIYLTAVGALHRPRALMTRSPSSTCAGLPDVNAAKKASMEKVKEAAVSMTKLAFDLESENYLRFLSTSSVPAFLSATLIHLLDVRDGDEGVRDLAIGRFYQCFHALYELQDMYSSAEYAIRFLTTVLKGMNANIPMLATLRMCASTMTDNTRGSVQPDTHSTSDYENYNVPLNVSAYGTPSMSNQFSMPAPMSEPVPDINHNNIPPDLNPDYFLANSQTTTDTNASAQIGNIPLSLSFSDQFAVSTPHMELWNGIDGLLPALLPFDTETQPAATGHDVRMPSTPWRSCK